MGVGEFWKLTFAEFWPLYETLTKPVETENKMTGEDVRRMQESFARGDFRRTRS